MSTKTSITTGFIRGSELIPKVTISDFTTLNVVTVKPSKEHNFSWQIWLTLYLHSLKGFSKYDDLTIKSIEFSTLNEEEISKEAVDLGVKYNFMKNIPNLHFRINWTKA